MVVPSFSAVEVFALASVVLLLVPGPSVLYVVAQSAEHGRRAGLASVTGIHVGTVVHIVAATVGLSALIVASATAFTAVKLVGACYLVYVGIRKLLERDVPLRVQEEGTQRRLFAQGVVVNVLNPKTVLFFLCFSSAVRRSRARRDVVAGPAARRSVHAARIHHRLALRTHRRHDRRSFSP
jgi:threonine/homoserine/homoserine lactone efflux protein